MLRACADGNVQPCGELLRVSCERTRDIPSCNAHIPLETKPGQHLVCHPPHEEAQASFLRLRFAGLSHTLRRFRDRQNAATRSNGLAHVKNGPAHVKMDKLGMTALFFILDDGNKKDLNSDGHSHHEEPREWDPSGLLTFPLVASYILAHTPPPS